MWFSVMAVGLGSTKTAVVRVMFSPTKCVAGKPYSFQYKKRNAKHFIENRIVKGTMEKFITVEAHHHYVFRGKIECNGTFWFTENFFPLRKCTKTVFLV